ncbi:hypothetical protein B1987_05190 [Mycobacterium kansasii]|uniref:Beta-lactamase n=1 Tax=Mycobacterium attenuatum TaxID=2341086 RepID=A0A498Q6X5_9MYCO|nr:serine hydrolase domain-containing protein [Mycobacterium attenuatum]ORB83323.1 hypothetical protein B1987_05190 [Mycobacterium kansasii]VBA41061.1 Beta-lactamase [Mycobacterium attenuatum]VBA60331.1 Beta-lactamase [Mycobacterium attenuatum]
MGAFSRREFARLAAHVSVGGVGGALIACGGAPAPRRSDPATTAKPETGTRPIRLTQSGVDRIIGEHARTLLDRLRARAPGRDYGVAVAFAYPNREFKPFYMYGTVGESNPPTEKTIFSIGSVTKTFTAALFATGVSLRPDCFDWDAGLQRYLSRYLIDTGDLSKTVQQITPRMLAQHTSGLAHDSTGPADGDGLFLRNPSAPPPSLRHAWHAHRGPQPGSCWQYSNLGFITLGFAAVSAYRCADLGESYAGVLRDQVTGPLTMPDTVTTVPEGTPVARAYPNGREVSPTAPSDLKSSAADMHTWLLANLGAVTGPEHLMRALATTTQPAPLAVEMCGQAGRGPAHMGLAWQVETGPPQIIWKDGLTSAGGCSCWIGITPGGPGQEPLGIAILVNGYWNKDKPAVLADNHGPAILREISAAG